MPARKISAPSPTRGKIGPRSTDRALVGELSSHLGRETLQIRIYRDGKSFVLEHHVERSGMSIIAVLPAKEPAAVTALLAADPYYEHLKDRTAQITNYLEKALKAANGDSSL